VFDRAVHVVVVGCGRVGARLATELVRDRHTVAVIDKSGAAFRRLSPGWGGVEIVGPGFDRDLLDEAGAGKAGALAAVTSGDNSNILKARIARETYGIAAVVARIYDPRRAEIYQRLGIPTVATVTWTTEQVLRRLFPDRTALEWSDPTGRIQLLERMLPASYYGKRLANLEQQTGARIVAVTRGGEPILGPGELVGQQGDILHIAINFSGRALLAKELGEPDDADLAREESLR
jgi:trk system potassium uptake protein